MKAIVLTLALTLGLAAVAAPAHPYTIVGTGQTQCYNDTREIAPPQPGQPFYGQDAQHPGVAASYTLSHDGLMVRDNNTGLIWQRSADTNGDGVLDSRDKLTWQQALAWPAQLNTAKFGGFTDWRLPTIKELYSLIQFSGMDVGPTSTGTANLHPFIDTKYFKFVYGDPDANERLIDSQWATSTQYVANPRMMFGVNFADGRIKGYGTALPGRGEKTFFVLCVRGNPNYGNNDFHDNGDGTITDRATGLMWSRADSGTGMNWEAALAWVQARNAEKYLGHADWRLPNVKELHSILDYTRSPLTTHSAAIDPVFRCTQITNEIGEADYPYFWSSTTHASVMGGAAAAYVAFGRAAGWPGMMGRPNRPPTAGPGTANPPYVDVHGAGAQRSDPKTGDPAAFPRGRGPQGDVVRIDNFVRCVRDAD